MTPVYGTLKDISDTQWVRVPYLSDSSLYSAGKSISFCGTTPCPSPPSSLLHSLSSFRERERGREGGREEEGERERERERETDRQTDILTD